VFHLAHKLYLCHENTIDTNRDRVVISQENGYYMHEVIQKISNGTLFKCANSIDDLIKGKDISEFFSELIDFCVQRDRPLCIYTDKKTFAFIQLAWFNLIFKEPSFETCEILYNSNVFKYDMFYKGRFSSNHGSNAKIDLALNTGTLKSIYDKVPHAANAKKRSFFARYSKYVSVEYLLASYVHNGSMKKELKENIRRLLRKDIEKYIYELKEIFVIHFTTRTFKERLGLEKEYDIQNMQDIVNDKSKFAELFMSNRLFFVSGMDLPSSKMNKNFRFEQITGEDVNNFKEFTVLSGTTWGEEAVYQFIKSDINKLDFIDIINGEFTDKRLEDLLNAESTYEHAAGSFFSIDLETVNNYLVEYILDSRFKNDRENLRSMTLC
jgi:hypothetical protein